MFLRFAAATAVVSVLVALAALTVALLPGVPVAQMAPVLLLWCIAPLVWGLWAMLVPRSWIPKRLPLWGAILGLMLGLVVMFVLDIPSRVAGVSLPWTIRGLGIALAGAFYYLFWMLVRRALAALSAPR